MTAPALGAPRFVAFSTIDDKPLEAGSEAGLLLDRVRELASLGIGLVRFTEILDCGGEAGEVLNKGTSLAEARGRFRTVFRDEGVPGLMPIALGATDVKLIPENDSGARVSLKKTGKAFDLI